MPWTEGIKGEVVNGARQKNAEAEGQRAPWVNVSMQVAGREDLAHVTIFDNPDNKGFRKPGEWMASWELVPCGHVWVIGTLRREKRRP